MSVAQTVHGGCNLCEAICGLEFTVADGRVVGVKGDPDDPLSRGHICPKAVALGDIHDDPDRLRAPVRRTDDGWQEITWDEAYDLVVERLAASGSGTAATPSASTWATRACTTTASLTHGQHFLGQLRTRNRFSASSVDQLPHQLVAYWLYGHQFLIPIPDIDRTDYFLVFGANPMASNGSLMTVPDFRRRLTDLRARGGKAVVFDPRRTETAAVFDEHHFVRPGTDAARAVRAAPHDLRRGSWPPGGLRGRPRRGARGHRRVHARAGRGGHRRRRRDDPPDRAGVRGGRGVPSATAASACRSSGTARCASGPSNCSTSSPATSTGPAGRCSPGRRSRSSGGRLASPGHYDKWRSRVRGLPEFAGELPVGRPGRGDPHPGRRADPRDGHRGRQSGALHPERRPARPGTVRTGLHGLGRLLRQRDHPARARDPAADQRARTRPLRRGVPRVRRTQHRSLLPRCPA